MPRLSHSSRFYHPNNTVRAVQIIKLLIMLFSPLSCHLVSPRPKYYPQHPTLKRLQPVFLPQCERPNQNWWPKCNYLPVLRPVAVVTITWQHCTTGSRAVRRIWWKKHTGVRADDKAGRLYKRRALYLVSTVADAKMGCRKCVVQKTG